MNVLETAYEYLTDIEAYFDGTLSRENLERMLCAMANDGLAFKLNGELRDEFDRMLATGAIQGVIQNAWDDLNECVIESFYEKSYFLRADAELIKSCQKGQS